MPVASSRSGRSGRMIPRSSSVTSGAWPCGVTCSGLDHVADVVTLAEASDPVGARPRSMRRADVRRAARVEEDVALADATASPPAGPASSSASPTSLGERAVVAGEAAREVGELRVVAAPLPHAVEALEDPAGDAARRVGVLVRARVARRRPSSASTASSSSLDRVRARPGRRRARDRLGDRSGWPAPIGSRRSTSPSRGRERERAARAGGRRPPAAPRRRAGRAR